MGNKGAVGISINLSGTTILVINAHLAGESLAAHLPYCLVVFSFLIAPLLPHRPTTVYFVRNSP